jgi:hypothetical protein
LRKASKKATRWDYKMAEVGVLTMALKKHGGKTNLLMEEEKKKCISE